MNAITCQRIVAEGEWWVDKRCLRPAVAVWVTNLGTRIPICARCRAAVRRTKSRFDHNFVPLPDENT